MNTILSVPLYYRSPMNPPPSHQTTLLICVLITPLHIFIVLPYIGMYFKIIDYLVLPILNFTCEIIL